MAAKNKIKFLVLDIDGVLTDGGMYYTENGDEFKKFNTKDGMGIKLVLKKGIEIGFISSGKNENIINSRAKLLGVKYVYVGLGEKLDVLRKWCSVMKITYADVAYIGDDINDLLILSSVGFSACPLDAVDKVKKVAKIKLKKNGGEGCVREFIDKYVL